MYICINAIEDCVLKRFCFASEDEFIKFGNFVETYITESGANTGVNAYWFMEDIYLTKTKRIPKYAKVTLRPEIIRHMALKIISERLAGEGIHKPKVRIGRLNGAISFSISNLPKKQKPKPGDMFRIFEPYAFLGRSGYFPMQGKVIKEKKDVFEIISVTDIKPNGKIRPAAMVYWVRKDIVMKVHDWTKYLRNF